MQKRKKSKQIIRPKDLDNLCFPCFKQQKIIFSLFYHVFGAFYYKYEYENVAFQQDLNKEVLPLDNLGP